MDIFGTSAESGTTTTGFCGRENLSNSKGSGFVEFGFKASASTTSPVSYSLSVTSSISDATIISNSSMMRLQRVLIVPNQIEYFTDSNLYKAV